MGWIWLVGNERERWAMHAMRGGFFWVGCWRKKIQVDDSSTVRDPINRIGLIFFFE